MFEINDLSNIQVEVFNGSKIFIADNFYKHPEQILDCFLHRKAPTLWKGNEQPSYNNIHFLDLRHSFNNDEFFKVGLKLSEICGQSAPASSTVKTNFIKLLNKEFNDYENNYWGPHRDFGYTALIYFNTVPAITNIYEQLEEDCWTTPEHFAPWRSKTKYKIIKQLEGSFNRLVMFDGKKFLHGMDFSNDDFFKVFRMNQVLFFKEPLT